MCWPSTIHFSFISSICMLPFEHVFVLKHGSTSVVELCMLESLAYLVSWKLYYICGEYIPLNSTFMLLLFLPLCICVYQFCTLCSMSLILEVLLALRRLEGRVVGYPSSSCHDNYHVPGHIGRGMTKPVFRYNNRIQFICDHYPKQNP